jgi:hypothetical protein
MMMHAIFSFETSGFTRATVREIPEYCILQKSPSSTKGKYTCLGTAALIEDKFFSEFLCCSSAATAAH